MPHRSRENYCHQSFYLLSNIIQPMKVWVVKNIVEDVTRGNVLNDHLTNVGQCNFRVDLCFAVFPKLIACLYEFFIVLTLYINLLAQGFNNGGQVFFKFFNGLKVIAHFGLFKIHKSIQDAVERIGIFHVGPQKLFVILIENGRGAIFKQSIGKRIAFLQFFSDLIFNVITFVFAFPITKVQPQCIFQHTIWKNIAAFCSLDGDFGNEFQVFLIGVFVNERIQC